MHIRSVGAAALLIECPADEVEAWRSELWRRRSAGELAVAEIVPGACTVLLDGLATPDAGLIAGWAPPPPAGTTPGDLVAIPTVYDGPDLAAVAALWSMPIPMVIDRLTETEFRVAFCGFAPGFGYLTGLPPELAVPRLATPRTSVPAGSVGLAGPYAGIYPTSSPGGWQLVGRTEVTLFDVDRDPPALLAPGTTVRLVRA
ncbi:allophanate hydrolase [Asanoa ishikariensis]|uniref:Sensor histidine kinase inhibitor, KipI family n=1 Tax=Asanoa ishikariensis TaxID=137265 RepID=A0A1H3UWI0_9ACTN|nr:allophanate hydrolase subunit 1 [Asanoa ishikariensis]GIF65267.1 allophanate hydrolase [Asanoa ishikariensis]SDZ66794.1 sensor histidine kinase inhibitor, KipI family [Asanoa ishikariensis]